MLGTITGAGKIIGRADPDLAAAPVSFAGTPGADPEAVTVLVVD